MKYFKNTDLAKIYNISEKSVRNWIQSATEGKLGLELFYHNDKPYIADTLGNSTLIKEMVERGRKYRNTRAYKAVSPAAEFYKLFNEEQVIDIISNLDTYREIPHGYSYFGVGADCWDGYTNRLIAEDEDNTLTKNIELLEFNIQPIDSLIAGYNFVNIVDIGPGNGLPVKSLLSHLHNSGKLKRYIGVDISRDMLKVVERNIQTWFKGKVKFEGYAKDINYERFRDIVATDSFMEQENTTINIVLLLGTMFTNFREPDQMLHTIRDSMGKDDFLITFLKLDSKKARRFFDFNAKADKTILSMQDKFILDMLNIDESFYDVEQFFDEQKKSRIIQIRLKVSISVNFKVGSFQKTLDLHKGESVLLWRALHYSDYEVIGAFDKNNFGLVQATESKDQGYLLLISKIKTTDEPNG